MNLPYPVPGNEQERLRVLPEYRLMDTPPEEDFEHLATLAARLFNMPIALISLLERDRQFFKAHVGFNVCETSREVSFCADAVMQTIFCLFPTPSEASTPILRTRPS